MSIPAAIACLILFLGLLASLLFWACCKVAGSESAQQPFDDLTDWEPEVGMFTLPEVYGETMVLGGARRVGKTSPREGERVHEGSGRR